MIGMKRRSMTLCDLSEEKTKKLRTTSDQRTSCFESLSNELYYEIFDYLEGCLIHRAFANLNTRFENLLADPSLRLKIDLQSCSEDLQKHSADILTSNRDQIISLILSRTSRNDENFPPLTIDPSFSRLESLALECSNSDKLIPLLVDSLSLPRLLTLHVCAYDKAEEINNIYQSIFNLPMLKYSRISLYLSETPISLPIAINGQFSSIEHLVINHSCTLEELIVLLSYTPRLRCLVCAEVDESNGIIPRREPIPISHLTHVSLSRCSANFNEMETFVASVSPQLEVLRLRCLQDPTYLNADRWERFIVAHLTHLRVFDLKYRETIDEDWEVTPSHTMMIRFHSSFWISRKWFFEFSLNDDDWWEDSITYAISPYRHGEESENSRRFITVTAPNVIQNGGSSEEREAVSYSLNLSEMNRRPSFNDVFYVNYEGSIIDIIGPILTILPISYLNITHREIFIGTLIVLIQYLPNLRSLVLSSLAMVHPRCLYVDEVRILRLVSDNNKTIRVNLQRMSDLAQVQALLDLCPRVEHLEVDCANDVSPEQFMRFILMKNIKHIPNLSSLCLKISPTQGFLVDHLKGVIALEQLCQNYTITQMDNQIHFQWN